MSKWKVPDLKYKLHKVFKNAWTFVCVFNFIIVKVQSNNRLYVPFQTVPPPIVHLWPFLSPLQYPRPQAAMRFYHMHLELSLALPLRTQVIFAKNKQYKDSKFYIQT